MAYNPFNTITKPNAGVPDNTLDSSKGYRLGDFSFNSTPNFSPGTAQIYICLSNTDNAANWGSIGYTDADRNYLCGNGVYGAFFTSAADNILIGPLAGRLITSGNENICLGQAGSSITTGIQNILIGQGAGAAITTDTGHVFIGVAAGQACSVAVGPPGTGTWSVVIGNDCASACMEIASSVIIGRGAAFRGTTLFNDSTIVGHGAAFYADNITSILAIGNQAGGNPLDGSAANYGIGTGGDSASVYIGDFSGKGTNSPLTNVIAIGIESTVGSNSNTAVMGKGLTDFYTGARAWGNYSQTDVAVTASTTLAANAVLGGSILRTGTLGGDFSDTLPTAALLISGSTGNGVEVSGSRMFFYQNNTSGGHIATLVAGTGDTVTGTATIANGAVGIFFMTITNSTASSEAVTFTRVNA